MNRMTRLVSLAVPKKQYLLSSFLVLTFAACSSTRDWPDDSTTSLASTQCKLCHGSSVNEAPPQDASGNTATTARGVGAHQSHLLASSQIAAAISCDMCHAVPTTMDHKNGTVEITFGELAKGNVEGQTARNLNPQFDAATLTCSNTYCHGSGIAGVAGTNTSPTWTTVDDSQDACGTCHGLPPDDGTHVVAMEFFQACSNCHSKTVSGATNVITTPANHINGKVDGNEEE